MRAASVVLVAGLLGGCLSLNPNDTYKCAADVPCAGGRCDAKGACIQQPHGSSSSSFSTSGASSSGTSSSPGSSSSAAVPSSSAASLSSSRSGGSSSSVSYPELVDGGWAAVHRVLRVAAGDRVSCAVESNAGNVWCWGKNNDGQLLREPGFTPSSAIPLRVAEDGGGVQAESISAGVGIVCAVTTGHLAQCWGNLSFASGGPLPFTVVESASRVAVGSAQICVITLDHRVVCTGAHTADFLGAISLDGGVLSYALNLATPTDIASAVDNTCVVTGGAVQCWGVMNDQGELGQEDDAGHPRPPVTSGAVQVSVGRYDGCAVLDDGGVTCWGALANAMSGNAGPTHVPLDMGATSVGVGTGFACAVLQDGAVWCWGSGQGGAGMSNSPLRLEGIPPVWEVSAGENHACARAQSSTAWCWGTNAAGETGHPVTDGGRAAPAPVQ